MKRQNLTLEEKTSGADDVVSRELFTTKDLARRQARFRRNNHWQGLRNFWRRVSSRLPEAQRLCDASLALILLVIALPVMGVLRLICGPIHRIPRLGRECQPFTEYTFRTRQGTWVEWMNLHRLPALWNIVRGEMAFVGPRAVEPDEMPPSDRLSRERYRVRPGIICLWWVRQRANIPFEGEAWSDRDYVLERSFWGDVGIVLRAGWASFHGGATPEAAVVVGRISLLDIPLDNDTMDEAVARLVRVATTDSSDVAAGRAMQVSFVNADCANISCCNAEYRRILQQVSHYNLADGVGLKVAGKLLKCPVRENVNGTDLFPRLCAALSETDAGIYLLGAKPGGVEAIAQWALIHYPGVHIAGMRHGYFSPEEEPEVIAAVRQSGARVLMVAFGAPHQEKWIAEHRHELGDVRVAMGVGGLFDFYSGQKQRAPQWLREMGMEWVFRLLLEPARLGRRYLIGNGVFVIRVLLTRWRRPSKSGGSLPGKLSAH